MADEMRLATPEVQCGDEAAHGEHEWLILGAFLSWCPGFVGRAGVPARRQPDPGALMEEPDLYRPHAALNERGHLRGCGCEDCERDDRG